MLQLTWSCPSTPSPRLIWSRVSVRDLQRVPARCSTRPVHRPKMQVAACSRGDASHGLFVTSPCKPPWHAVRGFQSGRRPVELPFAPNLGCTAQPRVHGSKLELNPSSWARVVPISRPQVGLSGGVVEWGSQVLLNCMLALGRRLGLGGGLADPRTAPAGRCPRGSRHTWDCAGQDAPGTCAYCAKLR